MVVMMQLQLVYAQSAEAHATDERYLDVKCQLAASAQLDTFSTSCDSSEWVQNGIDEPTLNFQVKLT